MSRLPISTKRPPGASSPRERTSVSPEAELRTTSTPRPPVSAMISSAKSRVRESMTCSTPRPRSSSRLAGVPAVAYTRAPRRRATCSAARPTPPVAEWMSTLSPARRRPSCSRPCTAVRNAMGTAAACSSSRDGGAGATRSSSRVMKAAMLPGPAAMTRSPTRCPPTPSPTAVIRPAHSAPSGTTPSAPG